MPAKPEALHTLLIISQVYVPDPASVGQHIADVAAEMAQRGWRVVVYTSARGYDDPSQRYPRREYRDGVEIYRLPFSSFGKRSIAARLIGQAIFLAQATLWGLFTSCLGAVLVSTSPPFAGFGGAIVSWIRRAPMTWWVMDLNPDQLIAAGKVGPKSLAARTFDWMNRLTLRQATQVVALDRFMEQRLIAKLPVPEKLCVIPPWPHENSLERRRSRPNHFRDEHQFGEAFVIMYSGNHALQHPLSTLLDAAAALTHDPSVVFVFVGGGAGKAAVDQRIASGATNIRSLPYQPLSTLADSLSAADVHVVSMGDDMVGIVHPCKIYGAMAIGRPILFFGPVKSHVGQIMGQHDIGWIVSHGDVHGAVAAIKQAMSMSEQERSEMGDTAAATIAESLSQRLLLPQLCDLIEPR